MDAAATTHPNKSNSLLGNAFSSPTSDDDCRSTLLVGGDREFNVTGFEKFTKSTEFDKAGLSYFVVAIIGPQISGKSTLLNHLFHTDFKEMDAFRGRSQTTKGIWVAKCPTIHPFTLVMDMEGTDGKERGEDTAFEKQTTLFALAVADVVLINIWCHDIGRENASNRPLLNTVFETPLEKLESQLRNDIQKIWESAHKPEAHKETPLIEFFNVEVVALSNYEEKKDTFKAEVAGMRQKFIHNELAGDRQAVVPASGFSLSSQEIWEKIIKERDLDIPSIKVMVATVRCEEIAKKKYSAFAANEELNCFGKKLSSMIDTCISGYDEEATYYDEGVKSEKRKQLEEKLLLKILPQGPNCLVQPAFQDLLELKRSDTLDKFKEALDKALDGVKGFPVTARNFTKSFMDQFDEGCADAVIKQANWDTFKVRDKLRCDIEAHVADKIKDHYEASLRELLSGPVEALLKQADDKTWPTIRKLLQKAKSAFAAAISGFDMDEQTKAKIDASLEKYARRVVEDKAKEEAGRVLKRMEERFITKFSYDSNSIPRVWNRRENIGEIARTAHSSSLEVLSVMAVIRLDGDNDGDKVRPTLDSALLGKDMSTTTYDLLALNTWEEGDGFELGCRVKNTSALTNLFPSSKTLIIPLKCKELWKEFKENTKDIVLKAIAEQEANVRFQLPPWAIGCLIFVGYNAITRLMRNPLCLGVGVILVAFLLVKPIWCRFATRVM